MNGTNDGPCGRSSPFAANLEAIEESVKSKLVMTRSPMPDQVGAWISDDWIKSKKIDVTSAIFHVIHRYQYKAIRLSAEEHTATHH
jgi:hypothetical protein